MTLVFPRFARLAGALGALLSLAAPAFAVPTSTATFTTTLTPTVRLNEVLAANTRIPNAGQYPDMVELYNAGSTATDLSGWSLTDDMDPVQKYTFPNGTSIPANGYLILYCDSVNAPLHTGFGLDAEGDKISLHDKTGAVTDSLTFGFQIPDFSLSRTGLLGNIWALTTPTFGNANGAAVALAAPASLKINEWAGNIVFRLDHDMIELYNTGGQPVAISGVRLTDDITPGKGFIFPTLSFMPATGFLPLYKGDYLFGLNGDRATVTLLGDNNEQIDQISMIAQPNDRSQGRSPDGSANIVTFDVPTPGLSNTTPLPAAYQSLLNNLRITEVMYQPKVDAGLSSSSFEYVELQNIGPTALDLSGVRFTNGIIYEFPVGFTLGPGAFVVVVNDRSSFQSRYPNAVSAMTPTGSYSGSLSNSGDTIALTLPAPWRVHILRFRYESSSWFPATAGGGYSLVKLSPATALQPDWQVKSGWTTSAAINGSPGAVDPNAASTSGGGTGGGSTVAAKLTNLSVRTAMASGQTLIVGVVVGGGGSRDVLVRAAGPALASFGLAGAMADPRLALYNGSTLTVQNDNWTSDLAPTFTSVGAFPFTTGSRDAALIQGIDGPRTIQAQGTGAGVVLVEAYDTGGAGTARLVNVSARNRVGTGDDILIAGFNIAGTGGKPLLIRAVGPKLGAFGVTGFLVDPKLEVYSGTTKIAENDNWDASLAPTFTAVGAFPLDPSSRDAALSTTLSPGSYTVQVSGMANGTGEALIEIYEVP